MSLNIWRFQKFQDLWSRVWRILTARGIVTNLWTSTLCSRRNARVFSQNLSGIFKYPSLRFIFFVKVWTLGIRGIREIWKEAWKLENLWVWTFGDFRNFRICDRESEEFWQREASWRTFEHPRFAVDAMHVYFHKICLEYLNILPYGLFSLLLPRAVYVSLCSHNQSLTLATADHNERPSRHTVIRRFPFHFELVIEVIILSFVSPGLHLNINKLQCKLNIKLVKMLQFGTKMARRSKRKRWKQATSKF